MVPEIDVRRGYERNLCNAASGTGKLPVRPPTGSRRYGALSSGDQAVIELERIWRDLPAELSRGGQVRSPV